MELLSATTYNGLPHRGRIDMLPAVARALEKVVGALPTTITPKDRNELILSILGDLEDQPESPSRHWPEDLKALALTAVKTLGRNPVGSSCLAERKQLATVLEHAGLLASGRAPPVTTRRPDTTSPTSSDASEGEVSASKKLHRRSASTSPGSLSAQRHLVKPRHAEPVQVGLTARQSEATSILANTLTLHPVLSRKNTLELGGGRGAVRMLRAGCAAMLQTSGKGKEREPHPDTVAHGERVFLLSRVLFLLTVQPGRFVLSVVDDEEGVATIVQVIESLSCSPSSYKALSEILKLLYTIVAQYNPSVIAVKGADKIKQGDGWNEAFNPLLPSLIHLVHELKVNDLLPPLTNVVNALTLFPVSEDLAPTWLGCRSSDAEPLQDASDRAGESPKKRSIYDRIARSLSGHESKPVGSGEASARLFPSSGASTSPRSSADSSRTDLHQHTTVHRLLTALDNFLSNTLPALPLGPDDPLPSAAKGVIMDDILPPVFALFTSLIVGSTTLRAHFKAELLPDNLDRSPQSTPLEKRPNLLGHLLRFLRATAHPRTQQTLDYFMWSLCDSNADVVLREIGYGNAAGLLFRRGITTPQPPKQEAHIEEINDDAVASKPGSTSVSGLRDPITSLKPETNPQPSPLAGMTDEEKEREAERLFTLFDRMDRNPAMKMANPMEQAVRRGDVDKWDQMDAAEEVRNLRLQEDIDEAEALKEMAAWKARQGRA